jgi:hypothetical protein
MKLLVMLFSPFPATFSLLATNPFASAPCALHPQPLSSVLYEDTRCCYGETWNVYRILMWKRYEEDGV